ncbi:MAG: DEAD/DEAH box helicase, partial [Pseudomonadota bacterium]
MNKFEALGVSPKLALKLEDNQISDPTPIQQEAIPIVLQGRDVMGLAQTGTGKTLAFGLPIIHNLIKIGTKPDPKTVRALILAPTRELAGQIRDNLRMFQGGGHLKINMVVGGVSMNPQRKALERGSDILVATPGRLIDLMEQGAVSLNVVEYLVFDEADQMLDMGFIHALRQIAKVIPEKRQTLLFSATMPKLMEELAATYLHHPRKVQVARAGKAADKITQSVHFIAKAAKNDLLVELLDKHR